MSLELELRTQFAGEAAAIAGVSAALDHEPAELPAALSSGAVVTLLGLPPAQQDAATTGIVLRTYSWRVNVYVNLLTGYQEAQHELADVLEALLEITVSDFNAGGLVDHWTLTGSGQEPAFAHEEGYVLQTLRLVATIETT